MPERLFLRLDGDPVCPPETDVPAATLRELAVTPRLAGYVTLVAAYREVIPPSQELVERVLPDGAVRLIFHLGGSSTPWTASAAGAVAAPTLVRLEGPVDGLSVTLRHGAAAAVLGIPAGELAAAAVPLEELWGASGRTLAARMTERQDDAGRLALLEDALLGRLAVADERGRRQAIRAARLIAEADGRCALREVASAIGVGERRLQQLFFSEVGLSPRAFGRIARLHACLRALRRAARPRWAELATEAGFYDQAHLANEFRALCGLSPSLFLERIASASSKTAG